MKQLTLIPVGGLANRLFAMTSAMAYCRTNGISLRIYWFKDWGMGADFHRLFILSPEAGAVDIRDGKRHEYYTLDKPRRKNFFLPALWQRGVFNTRIYEKDLYAGNPDALPDAFAQAGAKTYLVHFTKFYEEPGMLHLLQPNAAMQKRIRERIKTFAPYTVGIHIRRTDNVSSIRHSPLTAFIERMEEEIRLHPDVVFYVATDSEKDKSELMARFGSRLQASPFQADRSNFEGIAEGLTELYALAATRKIYGSFHSSYSRYAAELGGIPLLIATHDTTPSL